MASLAEVREKIGRANNQIDYVKRLLPGGDLAEIPFDRIDIKGQPDGETYDAVTCISTPSYKFRMAVGDIVHDLRSSLDYLAFQLAVLNGKGDEAGLSRTVNFLVYNGPKGEQQFKSTSGHKLRPYLSACAIAEIERLQPYKGLDPRACLLWILSELDNIDKHRMIVVMGKQMDPIPIMILVNDQIAERRILFPPDGPLKHGTKLFSIRLKRCVTPPKVSVAMKPSGAIVFADTNGVCDGERVIPTLRKISAAVTSVVDDFEKLFFV